VYTAASYAAAAVWNGVISLHPASLVAAFGRVRLIPVTVHGGYARGVPAFAAVLALALVLVPRVVGLW
jgi:hypothetical protein